MDRWKSRGGKSQRREEKKQEEQRRERVRRKKMQVREKVGKSRITVAPEGRKVGSLKRRVRSHLARWEMKNCTLLWCEAHFEVKSVKNCRSRGTFWSWDVEKVHAVMAQSTFRSQIIQSTELLRFSCCQLENWGSLAGFLRFWLLTLPRSKLEGVSQNSFVFNFAERQIDR